MLTVPAALEEGVAALAEEHGVEALERATARLVAGYHGVARVRPLQSEVDVVAYAAYRMPATLAAVRHALAAADAVVPGGLAAARLVDLGSGTGAAAWAACAALPSLAEVTLVDASEAMRRIGQRLAAAPAAPPPLASARWVAGDLTGPPPALGGTDLVTLAYVLGELEAEERARLADALADALGAGAVIAAVEPGTPDGYERIVALRGRLVEEGGTVLAPCPHDLACPIPRGQDWCHMPQRVARSPLHRRLKGADLPWEDEKLSYVVLAPAAPAAAADRALDRPTGRLVRPPVTRKGVVTLPLCTRVGALETVAVSKRQGPAYRAARKAGWGDAWRAGGPG